jgi:4-hydroxy-4-methyl-2-oxoglutarate aldolase
VSGKVGFRIVEGWRRPTVGQLAAFGEASSAQVADSMHRFGAMDAGMKPVWRSPRVIGPALTVWARSADNLMMHKALALAKRGDIVVINTQGNTGNAGFGELMATSALGAGIAAVIVDGAVRDCTALEALRLPVYSRTVCPGGCDKNGPGEIGTVIACGNVAVRPGDIVIADEDGITVVPLDDADEVAKLAMAAVAREQKRTAEIRAGGLFRPDIDEILERHGVVASRTEAR